MAVPRAWAPGDANGLQFERFDVSDIGSLAHTLRHLPSRTGIYWLRYDDDTEYVGQAIDVQKRLAWHRRHQPGTLVDVAFAPVPTEDLTAAERWMMSERAAAGASLRNLLIAQRPGGDAPGAFAVGDGLVVPLPWERSRRGRIGPEPVVQAEGTSTQAARWRELQEHNGWADVRAFLRAFLRETMSSPDLTAGHLWTISAMPSTSRSPGWRRLCTLNVGRIEAVFIGADQRGRMDVHWNLAMPEDRSAAETSLGLTTFAARAQVRARITTYADPTWCLEISSPQRAQALLEKTLVADLAYEFNTRYQRQGMALQRRWHNPLFAADLLGPD